MEISLDSALVEGIVRDELAHAREELAHTGPMRALELSQQRHDARLAAAADTPTLACKDGCFWCCYFTVDARPVEVLRIAEFMDRELPATERARVVTEIKANAEILAALDVEERARRNLKCPFLAAGRCTIYSVRPQTCRNYHATDAAGCQRSYENPNDDDIDPEFAPLVYQSGGAHVDAFSAAMREAGYDVDAYELNCALAAVLDNPLETRQRFEAKRSPFPHLSGTQVWPEFIDSDDE